MNDTPTTTTTATATTIHSSYYYSCIPSTITKNESYYNTITNETLVVSTNVDIYEIGILFDYEIHHSKNVSIYETNNSGGLKEKESGGGWYDNTKNFFGNLFGNGDDNDESENIKLNDEINHTDEGENNNTDGRLQLQELEMYMISQFWKDALLDDDMRYDSSNNNQNCTGLIIGRSNNTSMTTDIDIIDVVASDENNTYDDETRLLGISYMPLDYINLDGCADEQQHPTAYNTCTSIHGQVNVAYSGMNEYGVIQTVILRLWDGMENGSYIPPLWKKGHEDVQLVFLGAGDAVPVSNIGQSISIDSTASVVQAANKDDDNGRSSNNLSKYGLLFVCFVAILGTGTFAAMYVRYKRRLRRKKGVIQTVDANDNNSSSIEGEVVERQEQHEDVTRTAPSSRSPTPSIIYDSPSNVLNEVDVSVASGEIEVNLPPSPIVVADDDVTTTSTRKKWWVSIPMTRN